MYAVRRDIIWPTNEVIFFCWSVEKSDVDFQQMDNLNIATIQMKMY